MSEPDMEDAMFDFGRGDSAFDLDGKVGPESIRVTTGFIHVLLSCSGLSKPDDVMLDLGNENEMLDFGRGDPVFDLRKGDSVFDIGDEEIRSESTSVTVCSFRILPFCCNTPKSEHAVSNFCKGAPVSDRCKYPIFDLGGAEEKPESTLVTVGSFDILPCPSDISDPGDFSTTLPYAADHSTDSQSF